MTTMIPRHAAASAKSRSLHGGAFAKPAAAPLAPEPGVPSHDPSVRERLEVAAAHLRLARRAAGSGLATWLLRREVELAGREILIARRTIRSAVRRDTTQSHMLDRLARAAAELQRSTREAARLLDEPIATHR